MFRIRPLEGFLIQFIGYTLLWLSNDYIASLITTVFTAILIAVLIISFIVELIEPSKVPRSYFVWMGVSVLAPILSAVIFVGIIGAPLEWLN